MYRNKWMEMDKMVEVMGHENSRKCFFNVVWALVWSYLSMSWFSTSPTLSHLVDWSLGVFYCFTYSSVPVRLLHALLLRKYFINMCKVYGLEFGIVVVWVCRLLLLTIEVLRIENSITQDTISSRYERMVSFFFFCVIHTWKVFFCPIRIHSINNTDKEENK